MRITNTGFNFTTIQNCIDAARSLQEAGLDKDATHVMEELARKILYEEEAE